MPRQLLLSAMSVINTIVSSDIDETTSEVHDDADDTRRDIALCRHLAGRDL